MKKIKSVLSILLILCFISTSFNLTYATNITPEAAHQKTAQKILSSVTNPSVSSIGGEWSVIGLSQSNIPVSKSFFDIYFNNLKNTLIANKGILSERKYTEYSRAIIAVNAINKNPSDIAGYNLLKKLADYNKVVFQGINGAVFALIALDSGNYEIPTDSSVQVQATKEKYINFILSKQLTDGSFSFDGKTGSIDITSMVIQALSKYISQNNVKLACENAVKYLSEKQNENGGYSENNIISSESVAQVILGLTSLGIDPKTDLRFKKANGDLLSNLLTYYVNDGGFKHVHSDTSFNLMATEQCFYALTSYIRLKDKQNLQYTDTNTFTLTSKF